MRVATTLVSYHLDHNWDWTRQAVTTFRQFLGDVTLVVVDHNHVAEEQYFLRSKQVVLIENHGKQRHGDGMDAALYWARDNGYDVLVHIEPDCLVIGRTWYDNLITAIERGYWMAGTCTFPCGYVHPCPSAWRISEVKHSFNSQYKMEDRYLDDYKWLVDETKFGEHYEFHESVWDTSLKNWFEFARRHKVMRVSGNGIIHFWNGRQSTPKEAGCYNNMLKLL